MLEQLAEQDRIDQMSAAARRVKCAEECMHTVVTFFQQCTECDMTQCSAVVLQAPGTHQGRRKLPGAEAGAVPGCLGVPAVPLLACSSGHSMLSSTSSAVLVAHTGDPAFLHGMHVFRQARERAQQSVERAEEARKAHIVDQERMRLLQAVPHLHAFLPPGTLRPGDRDILDAAVSRDATTH